MSYTDEERGLLKGVALIVFLKVVVVGMVGLDPDAWYVWIWSWLAFAWAWPWLSTMFGGREPSRSTTKTRASEKGALARDMGRFALVLVAAFALALDAIINADKYQEY